MKLWRNDPEVEPGSVGVDAATLDAIAGEFETATRKGELFHGAQMAVYRSGARVLEMGGGLARQGHCLEPDPLADVRTFLASGRNEG